jgi:hypothetical protein
MTGTRALAGALLMLALPAATLAEPAPVPPAAGASAFAPPLDQPMHYRVTTRRLSREGTLISFSLVYALRWSRLGRGYRLDATLDRIESDARPELVAALTGVLKPLVGEPVSYIVSADGHSVELADPDGLWARVAARTEALGAKASRPEARAFAAMLAALPPEERAAMAAADIRALVAPANDALASGGTSAAVTAGDGRRTVTRIEADALHVADRERPLRIESTWTIDEATGLVLRERRQSWLAQPRGQARTLVEERVRALSLF